MNTIDAPNCKTRSDRRRSCRESRVLPIVGDIVELLWAKELGRNVWWEAKVRILDLQTGY